VDSTKVSESDLYRLFSFVSSQPDNAGSWIDQSINPTPDNDPAREIVVAAFTSNISSHEADLRTRWGGPLCVVEHPRSLAQLNKIEAELLAPAAKAGGVDVLAGGPDVVRDAVTADVLLADQHAQDWADSRFGPGAVILSGALHPIGALRVP
jgi:hypothetical protein